MPSSEVPGCELGGKYALALSHWGRPSEGMLGSIKSMRAAAEKLGNTDLVMVREPRGRVAVRMADRSSL